MTFTKARSIFFTLFFSSIIMACTPGDTGSNVSETPATAEEIRELISGKSLNIFNSDGVETAEEYYESDGTFKLISLSPGVDFIGFGTWEITTSRTGAGLIRTDFEAFRVSTNNPESREIEIETLVFIRDDQSSIFAVLSGGPTGRTPPKTEFANKSRFDQLLRLATR